VPIRLKQQGEAVLIVYFCPIPKKMCQHIKQYTMLVSRSHWAKSKACKGRQGEVKYVGVNQTSEELDGMFLGSEETA